MKNTFFISKKNASFIIGLLTLFFLVFGGMLILSIFSVNTSYVSSAILCIFLLIGIASIKTFKKEGLLDKITISDEGIRVFRGKNNQILFAPWNDSLSIALDTNGMKEVARIDYNDMATNNDFSLFIVDNSEIIKLLKLYYGEFKIADENKFSKNVQYKGNKAFYTDLKAYTGKGKFNIDGIGTKIAFACIYGIGGLIAISTFLIDIINESSNITFSDALPTIFFVSAIIYFSIIFHRKVYINTKGVKIINKGSRTKRFFTWEEIKTIGLGVQPYGANPSSGFLYFSTVELTDNLIVPRYSEAKDIIIVKMRPKIIHCVLNYWDKGIRNLENDKKWEKYLDKNRMF